MKYILLLILALFNYEIQLTIDQKTLTIGIALNEKVGAVIKERKRNIYNQWFKRMG